MVRSAGLVFSDRVDRAIGEFAATMGLAIRSGALDAYSFSFQRLGTFTLTSIPHAERTMAGLVFKPERWDGEPEARLFAFAQSEWPGGRMLRPGLTDRNEVVLAVGIDDDAMNVQVLDQCLQQLLAIRARFG